MKETKIDYDIVNVKRENDALKFQNTTLQSKIVSLENQYKFELALLKRKNEELNLNSKTFNDFKNLEDINQQLQRKVHRYRLEIIKKNGEINGLIFENKKLFELSLAQQPPPLSSSSQERKDEINTLYEEKEESDGESTMKNEKLRCHLSPNVHKFKQSLTKKAVIRDLSESYDVAEGYTRIDMPRIAENHPRNQRNKMTSTSQSSTEERKPK